MFIPRHTSSNHLSLLTHEIDVYQLTKGRARGFVNTKKLDSLVVLVLNRKSEYIQYHALGSGRMPLGNGLGFRQDHILRWVRMFAIVGLVRRPSFGDPGAVRGLIGVNVTFFYSDVFLAGSLQGSIRFLEISACLARGSDVLSARPFQNILCLLCPLGIVRMD